MLTVGCSAVLIGGLVIEAPRGGLEAFVSACLLAIAMIVSRMLYGTFLSPLGLFGFAWEGGLFLASLHLVAYDPMSLTALLMLHGSFVVFMTATFFVGVGDDQTMTPPTFPSWAARLTVALGIAGVALGLANLAVQLGLTAILTQPLALRQELWVTNGIDGYLRYLLFAGAAMVRPASRAGVSLLVASLLWAFLSSDRGFFLLVAAILIVGIAIRRPHFGRMQALGVATIVVLSIALFVSAGALLGKNDLGATQVADATGTNPILPAGALSPYVYATGGFVAFARYTDVAPPGQLGAQAVVTPLSRLGGEKENIVYEFRFIPFPYNVYTYLRGWYDAYGIVGTMLGPALFGFISAFAYRLRNRSAAWAYFSVLFTAGVVMGIANANLSYSGYLGLFALCPMLALAPRIRSAVGLYPTLNSANV